LGYPYRRRFASKIALAHRKEGDGVEVGPITEQVVKGNDPRGGCGGEYVKEIWLMSGWAMGWQVKTTVL